MPKMRSIDLNADTVELAIQRYLKSQGYVVDKLTTETYHYLDRGNIRVYVAVDDAGRTLISRRDDAVR